MIGIALMAAAFAYGRLTPRLGLMPFVIIAMIAIGLTFLVGTFTSLGPVAEAAINFAWYTVLFLLGHALGRWLDRDKYDA